MEHLLSRAEVAEALSVSDQTVSRMIADGRLTSVKVGIRRIAITADSFRGFLASIGAKVEDKTNG